MTFEIKRQESNSRGELLLRTFFGFFYIGIPHAFLMFFASLWGSILTFISFWTILFTGRYPESYFEYNLGLMRWSARVNASFFNMIDGYPAFGTSSSHPDVLVDIPYPENLSRGTLLLKFFLGIFYVLLPHGICLFFLALASNLVLFISWWAVLFTGKFPASLHEFLLGYLRWNFRVNAYMSYMTDKYPPFSLS